MAQEEFFLLIQDLCARLPYGVCVHIRYKEGEPCYGKLTPRDIQWFIDSKIKEIKPYLRPISSMTEEEEEELEHLSDEYFGKALDKQIQESLSLSNRNESRILEYIASSKIVDWLNAHHFDYRGLIEKGLALEVTEENNPYEN